MSNLTERTSIEVPFDTEKKQEYQIIAILVINILLLIERAFKSFKVFWISCKHGRLSCGSTTPPESSSTTTAEDPSPTPKRKKRKNVSLE